MVTEPCVNHTLKYQVKNIRQGGPLNWGRAHISTFQVADKMLSPTASSLPHP